MQKPKEKFLSDLLFYLYIFGNGAYEKYEEKPPLNPRFSVYTGEYLGVINVISIRIPIP